MGNTATICGAVCLFVTTSACSVSTPLTPAPVPASPQGKAADGSTIKATAPQLISPINNDRIPNERPTFIIGAATGQFRNVAFLYEFELTNDAGELVRADTANTTQFQLPVALAFDSAYRWRSRAVQGGGTGPWSNPARFFTALPPQLGRPTRNSPESEWRAWFMQLVVLRNQPRISEQSMGALRPDLLAVEVDWQNGWRGDYRPRLFLPVPGCPSTAANNPNADRCAYNRTVDVGDIGGAWEWFFRGST